MEYLMLALAFMFSGFWHFIGCLILIGLVFEAIIRIILAIRGIPTCNCDGDCPDCDFN